MPQAFLSDVQKGDKFLVTNRITGRTYFARIMSLATNELFVVVDYHTIGPVGDIPEPWASCRWEKVVK